MIDLTPVLVLACIFGGVSTIIYIVATHKLRRKIVEAGKLEMDPETIKTLFYRSSNKLGSLKWGIISLFSGLGLIVNHFLALDGRGLLLLGIELSFVALGFLIYFAVARSLESK